MRCDCEPGLSLGDRHHIIPWCETQDDSFANLIVLLRELPYAMPHGKMA